MDQGRKEIIMSVSVGRASMIDEKRGRSRSSCEEANWLPRVRLVHETQSVRDDMRGKHEQDPR